MFHKAIVSIAVLALLSVPAGAQESAPSSGVFKTGQQIYDLCVSKDAADLDMCDYFLMGAHDMIKLYGDTGIDENKICLPVGIKAIELRTSILAYWRGKMGGLKYSAVSSIRNALFDKYPC